MLFRSGISVLTQQGGAASMHLLEGTRKEGLVRGDCVPHGRGCKVVQLLVHNAHQVGQVIVEGLAVHQLVRHAAVLIILERFRLGTVQNPHRPLRPAVGDGNILGGDAGGVVAVAVIGEEDAAIIIIELLCQLTIVPQCLCIALIGFDILLIPGILRIVLWEIFVIWLVSIRIDSGGIFNLGIQLFHICISEGRTILERHIFGGIILCYEVIPIHFVYIAQMNPGARIGQIGRAHV